jgi:hypothetical protein
VVANTNTVVTAATLFVKMKNSKRLPLLPSECNIVILRRRGAIDPNDTAVFEDFRVRRDHIQQWLDYLRITIQLSVIQISRLIMKDTTTPRKWIGS